MQKYTILKAFLYLLIKVNISQQQQQRQNLCICWINLANVVFEWDVLSLITKIMNIVIYRGLLELENRIERENIELQARYCSRFTWVLFTEIRCLCKTSLHNSFSLI